MINIDLRISNPLHHKWSPIRAFFGKITDHIAYEINLYKSNTIVNLYLRVQTNGDHKGIFLILGLLSYDLELNIYDTRHAK